MVARPEEEAAGERLERPHREQLQPEIRIWRKTFLPPVIRTSRNKSFFLLYYPLIHFSRVTTEIQDVIQINVAAAA